MTLKDIIIKGWAERRHDVPRALHPYWPFCDELAVEDGLIVKGECIIIPASQEQHVFFQLHEGHQGSEKTKLRAKECVFRVGITKDIDTLVKNCPTCQRFQTAQPRETLLQHTRPWQVVGTDLFSLEVDNFLIMANSFIRKLPVPCTSQAETPPTKSPSHGVLTISPIPPTTPNPMDARAQNPKKKTIRKAWSSGSDVNMALTVCVFEWPLLTTRFVVLHNYSKAGNSATPSQLLTGSKISCMSVRVPKNSTMTDKPEISLY